MLEKLHMWQQTKTGLLVYGLLELALAYVFLLWAIDSGSLLDWFFTLLLLAGGLQALIKLLRVGWKP